MTATPTGTYVSTLARYFCGCVYKALQGEPAVVCPSHQGRPATSFITGMEGIRLPAASQRTPPQIPLNRRENVHPYTLFNNASNSLHTVTYVMDGNHNEWTTPEAVETGLCCACFIDREDSNETFYSLCECGNDNCTYRWCGDTDGLHGFWALHVQGKTEEETGIPDEHIFAHGGYEELPESTRNTLDEERLKLEAAPVLALNHMKQARAQPHPRTSEIPYLSQWLDEDFRDLTTAKDTKTTKIATALLQDKLKRFFAAGIINPSP